MIEQLSGFSPGVLAFRCDGKCAVAVLMAGQTPIAVKPPLP